MKLVFIFTSLFFLLPASALSQTWTVIPVDTGSLQGPVMQIDSKDYVHIAYTRVGSKTWERIVRYALWNKSNWTYYDLDTTRWTIPQMAITQNGYPCIEYSDTLQRFNGISWTKLTVPDTVGSCQAIAFDNLDTLNALTVSPCTSSIKTMYWLRFMSGVWSVSKVLETSCSSVNTGISSSHSMLFDNQNHPWILYVLAESLIVISHWNGSVWLPDTVEYSHMGSFSNVISTDFVLDEDNKPHLIYECGDSIYYAYRDGIGWNKMLLYGLDATALTICMNPLTNRPVVSFAPKRFAPFIYADSLYLAYYEDGFIWHYELIDTMVYTPDHYGKLMDFDSGDRPTVAYLKYIDGNGFFVRLAVRSDPVAVDDEEIHTNRIKAYSLFQNYPNPFNQSTRIEFSLSHSGFVNLSIYDLLGRKVRTLVSENLSPGYKYVMWDGKDDSKRGLSSGIYFYQLKVGDLSETKKLVLLK